MQLCKLYYSNGVGHIPDMLLFKYTCNVTNLNTQNAIVTDQKRKK